MKILSFILMAIMMVTTENSIYDFKVRSIDGQVIDFSTYKGKTLLLVNVDAKGGYTPQYADLEILHKNYADKIIVLGFPSSNFGAEEPRYEPSDRGILPEKLRSVKFQMFESISVKGEDQHPLYKMLKEKSGGKEPGWNFCKYLVKPDGSVKFFDSKVNPLNRQITDEL